MSYSPVSYPTTAPTGALGMNEAIGILKELYDNQKVMNMAYEKSVLLAMLPKMEWFGGEVLPQPVITSAGTGRSSTFATAQANQSPFVSKKFMITSIQDYAIASIDRRTMKAAASDKMSFIRSTTSLIDNAILTAAQSLSSALYRDGTGAIGQYSAISTGVITLTDPNQIVNFEVAQVLESRATAGGTISTSSALGYVIAVNRAAGTLTVSATAGGSAGTPTNWSTSFPFLNVQGDNNLKLSGLGAWLPATATPSATPFFSVDRSSDWTRLAGVYYDGSNQSIEEALVQGSSAVGFNGGEPDICILSYSGYAALQQSLGSRAVYETMKGPAEIAFKGIVLNTGSGQLRVFPDRWCPGFTGYMLQLNTWQLASLGGAPEILDYDDVNGSFLRLGTSDAAELRVGYIANLVCNAPGFNGNLKLVA